MNIEKMYKIQIHDQTLYLTEDELEKIYDQCRVLLNKRTDYVSPFGPPRPLPSPMNPWISPNAPPAPYPSPNVPWYPDPGPMCLNDVRW
jgi:hypothetical protein